MSIKNIDLGSKMNFGNARRAGYSLATQKESILTEEQENIVRIQIDKLESAPEEWNFYPALQGEEFDRSSWIVAPYRSTKKTGQDDDSVRA